MITTPWELGLVIAGFVLNAVLLYFTYRYSRQSTAAAASGASAPEGGPAESDGGAVECRHCGAENETGYRFCRACVAELPGATGYGQPGGGQAGRASL